MILRYLPCLQRSQALFAAVLLGFLTSLPTEAANPSRNVPRATRGSAKHVQPVQWRSTSRSTLAKAAQGKVLTQLPPKPLDGSLVRNIRQVGYADYCDGGCGAVCTCGAEPTCGCAGPVCGCEDTYIEPGCGCPGPVCGCETEIVAEPTCGCAGPVCGCEVEAYEPVCGCDGPSCTCGAEVEVGCGIEPGCGCDMSIGCSCDAGVAYEPGCAADYVIPSCDGGCDAGCDGLCSSGCGLGGGGSGSILPMIDVDWNRFALFGGVQGFKNSMNFPNTGDATGASSSFGFYQGINYGQSLKGLLGNRGQDLAFQLGLRATQSNLSSADFVDETRHQIFLTGGIFRRVDYGFQFGVVADYLNEDWYYQSDLVQFRGEFSWNTGNVMTYGFQYMVGVDNDSSTTEFRNANGSFQGPSVSFNSLDQYRAFARRKVGEGGSAMGFVGGTENNNVVLGGLIDTPLSSSIALSTGATYLIPDDSDAFGANQREAWNVSVGLVFQPAGFCGGCYQYSRPLFNVADNGTFLVNRL